MIADENTWVKLYRKSENSRVFRNEGLWKIWTWCLMRASITERWVTFKTGKGNIEVFLTPGQFVFGRRTAAEKLRMNPNTIWKRMQKLKNMQNLNIQSNRQYSIITINNWDTYQVKKENGNNKSVQQVSSKCPASNTNKNVKNVYISPAKEKTIEEMIARYSDKNLVTKTFNAFAGTRKTNSVAKSILQAEMTKWEKFPPTHIEKCMKIYLDGQHHLAGKKENYLWGIIRGNNTSEYTPQPKKKVKVEI